MCQGELPTDATVVTPATASHTPQPIQFSLATLLLLMTVVCLCVGLVAITPGLVIPLVLVVVPALVRSVSATRLAGVPASMSQKIATFGASLGMVILIWGAGLIAFGTACTMIVVGSEAASLPISINGLLWTLFGRGSPAILGADDLVVSRHAAQEPKKAIAMQLRDHTFLGMTESLCPECLALVPAKIIVRDDGRVYFRKRCPAHGVREDFICSDVRHYDRMEFSLPGKVPPKMGVEPERGCPYDCGLCTEHEQHTCVGLVEITSSCNLACPMCYAHSGPGGKHLSFDECRRSIDRLVEVEGRPEVLQLSGGEPTIHPEFLEVFEYGCRQPIDVVMINTNGIRFAHDAEFTRRVAENRHRLEVYFQFDGFSDDVYRSLRGEPLLDVKLRALDNLGRHGIRTTLVTTLQPGVNEDEIGDIVRFGLERPWITGFSFQPATYSGRFVLPEELERRITFPDVVERIVDQTDGLFETADFMPLPCAHPNCHTLGYVYRSPRGAVPLSRFIDATNHLDLLANGITFNRPRARQLIEQYLGRLGCCSGGNCGEVEPGNLPLVNIGQPLEAEGREKVADEFFRRALAEDLSPEDVFRITITSFLDAYNFDVRRVMKCCIHHVLPSGHVIPFCAYNVLYRDGHVILPQLRDAVAMPAGREPLVPRELPVVSLER